MYHCRTQVIKFVYVVALEVFLYQTLHLRFVVIALLKLRVPCKVGFLR